MKELVVEAKIERLEEVQDFVRSALDGCTPKVLSKIAISVDEVFSNIANYAYRHEIGNATVRVTVDDDIKIEFEDSGMAYNPLDNEDPDLSLDADERQIGGLGIFMVKNLMDSVEYVRKENKNILTIKKGINSQSAS